MANRRPLVANTGVLAELPVADTLNAVRASTSATLASGYATGAGGAVTQITGRTTGVTLSKPCGAITLIAAATTAGQTTTCTVTNTLVAATDTIVLTLQTGAGIYFFTAKAAAGSFNLSVYTPAAVVSEAPVINFAIVKAVSA